MRKPSNTARSGLWLLFVVGAAASGACQARVETIVGIPFEPGMRSMIASLRVGDRLEAQAFEADGDAAL